MRFSQSLKAFFFCLSILVLGHEPAFAQRVPDSRFKKPKRPAVEMKVPTDKIAVDDLIPTLELEGFIGAAQQGGLNIIPIGFDVSLAKEFYDAEGPLSVVIPGIYLTEIEADIGIGTNRTIPYIEVAAQVSYMAYRYQNLRFNDKDEASGHRFTISASSGADFEREPSMNGLPGDFFANVHLIGPRAEIDGILNGHAFKMTMAFYLDYAVIGSLAATPYLQAQNPGQQITLGSANRYEGLGQTGSISFGYDHKIFHLGAALHASRFESEFIENEQVRRLLGGNSNLKDLRIKQQYWLGIEPHRHWGAELGGEILGLRGQILTPNYQISSTGNRVFLKIKYRL